MTPGEIIETLNLAPHPEGGHYLETWVADNEGRPAGTCIYFLLQRGEHNRWHRVDAAEIWHFYAGDPLILRLSQTDAGPARREVLGPGIPHDDATRVVDRAIPRMGRCRAGDVTHRVRAQMLVGIGGTINIAQPDPNSDHGDTATARCVAQAIRAAGPVQNTEMGGIFYADVTLPPR